MRKLVRGCQLASGVAAGVVASLLLLALSPVALAVGVDCGVCRVAASAGVAALPCSLSGLRFASRALSSTVRG